MRQPFDPFLQDLSSAQADAGPVLGRSDELDACRLESGPDLFKRTCMTWWNALELLQSLDGAHSHVGSLCQLIR
jgi:hypothetical protein